MLTAESLAQRQQQIDLLRRYWHTLIEEYLPNPQQFGVWLDRYTTEIVQHGIKRTGVQANKRRNDGAPMDPIYLLKYASACMRNHERDLLEIEARKIQASKAVR